MKSTTGQVLALQLQVEQLKKENDNLAAQVRSLRRLKGSPEGSNPQRRTGRPFPSLLAPQLAPVVADRALDPPGQPRAGFPCGAMLTALSSLSLRFRSQHCVSCRLARGLSRLGIANLRAHRRGIPPAHQDLSRPRVRRRKTSWACWPLPSSPDLDPFPGG